MFRSLCGQDTQAKMLQCLGGGGASSGNISDPPTSVTGAAPPLAPWKHLLKQGHIYCINGSTGSRPGPCWDPSLPSKWCHALMHTSPFTECFGLMVGTCSTPDECQHTHKGEEGKPYAPKPDKAVNHALKPSHNHTHHSGREGRRGADRVTIHGCASPPPLQCGCALVFLPRA